MNTKGPAAFSGRAEVESGRSDAARHRGHFHRQREHGPRIDLGEDIRRKSKSQLRHRMIVTQLCPGMRPI